MRIFSTTFKAFVGSVGLLAVALTPAAAQEKPPVKIAVIMPLSGPGAFDGQNAVDSAQAIANRINAAGGILGGRKIQIVSYDDKGSPEEGVSAAKRAIEDGQVDAITASIYSTVALAMKEVTRDRILHFAAAPQHPSITKEGHKWLFRGNETNVTRSERFAKFICERMGLKSISMLTINDDYGRAEVSAYQPKFEACGIKVLGNEFFERPDTEFTVQLTKIKGDRADAIYVTTAATAQGATIYRQIKQLGYPGKVIAAGGNMNPKLVELSGRSLEGIYSVVMFSDTLDNPQAKSFIQEFKKISKDQVSHIGGLTAETIEVIAGAMDKAGSSKDYDKIASIIRGTSWSSVRGQVTFDEIGQGHAPNIIVQVQGGKLVPVQY
jgi:branched-chain amino acid transport system substrate-binding protein